MLVFRRKVGDAVILDGRVEVEVLEIAGSRVKLGFKAPPDMRVVRKELHLTQEENRRAASAGTQGLTLLARTLSQTGSADEAE